MAKPVHLAATRPSSPLTGPLLHLLGVLLLLLGPLGVRRLDARVGQRRDRLACPGQGTPSLARKQVRIGSCCSSVCEHVPPGPGERFCRAAPKPPTPPRQESHSQNPPTGSCPPGRRRPRPPPCTCRRRLVQAESMGCWGWQFCQATTLLPVPTRKGVGPAQQASAPVPAPGANAAAPPAPKARPAPSSLPTRGEEEVLQRRGAVVGVDHGAGAAGHGRDPARKLGGVGERGETRMMVSGRGSHHAPRVSARWVRSLMHAWPPLLSRTCLSGTTGSDWQWRRPMTSGCGGGRGAGPGVWAPASHIAASTERILIATPYPLHRSP